MGSFSRSLKRGLEQTRKPLGKQANIPRYWCPSCKSFPKQMLWSAPDVHNRKTLICGECVVKGIAVPLRTRNLFASYDPKRDAVEVPNAAQFRGASGDRPEVGGTDPQPAAAAGVDADATGVEGGVTAVEHEPDRGGGEPPAGP